MLSIFNFFTEFVFSFLSFFTFSCRRGASAAGRNLKAFGMRIVLVIGCGFVAACGGGGGGGRAPANPLPLEPPETFSVLSVFDLQFLTGSSLRQTDFSGADDAFSGYATIVRDPQGRAERADFYDGDGRLYYYERYIYNLTTGRLVELHEYDGGGERREYSRYGYNLTTGRLVRADYYDDDGSLLGYTLYGYNLTTGRPEREDDYYGSETAAGAGGAEAVKYRTYEYNAEGRLIRKDFYRLSNRVAPPGTQDASTEGTQDNSTSTQGTQGTQGTEGTQDNSTSTQGTEGTQDNSTSTQGTEGTQDNSTSTQGTEGTQDNSTSTQGTEGTQDNSTSTQGTEGTQDNSTSTQGTQGTQDNSTYTQDSYEVYIYDPRGRLIRRDAYDGSGSLKGFAALIYATDAWSVGAPALSASALIRRESFTLTLSYSCSGFCPAVNISWYRSSDALLDFSDTFIGGGSLSQSDTGSFMRDIRLSAEARPGVLLLLCVHR